MRALSGIVARASVLLALVVAFFALVLAASAGAAAKGVLGFFGSDGAAGGQFNGPSGVAVNWNGAGGVAAGDVYVADSGNNRIQQFDADGNFIRAWGWDVV